MDVLVLTVAGLSTRFSASIGYEVLKCTYTESGDTATLLYRILDVAERFFDKIVVVGGYRYRELQSYISCHVSHAVQQKIELVFNERFSDFGSGWSLLLGLKAIDLTKATSVTFVEGDLYFDIPTFEQVCQSRKDTITYNHRTIDAATSVAFYIDAVSHPHYIYDTAHGDLFIPEPFMRIYNSGQAWKFTDPKRLQNAIDGLHYEQHAGTNLELINAYFSLLTVDEICLLGFDVWINCNTVWDYRSAFEKEKK